MDPNIQKLKNRLNIKFQPIHAIRKSLKKLQQTELKQKSRNEEKGLDRSRSISQVKLPKLSSNKNIKLAKASLQDSKSYVNIAQLREKAKSMKQIPKVRTEGKQKINETITYLMKNEILTVPRIVALLQKNQSDEFIYLKMTGMYQYEACDEKQAGHKLVTVSKNGLVQNGELLSLQVLVRQFQLFKKLKKINFFKHFIFLKFMSKWKEGSKKVRYTQNRKILSKLLNLNDQKLFTWKIQIFSLFDIQSQGGWLDIKWVHKISESLSSSKAHSIRRLAYICFRMLQQFDLPISDSTDLMNRVLNNLTSLSITFEKKLRIEKQCQKFYKLGRQLQLSSMQKVANFILTHLQTLINKTNNSNKIYVSTVLQKLQRLDINLQKYTTERDQVFLNSPSEFDITYFLYYNEEQKILAIRPSPQDIYNDCIRHIKLFAKQMDKLGFRMLRTADFRFIIKNIFKAGEDEQMEQERQIFQNFVFNMNKYQQLVQQLQNSFIQCQLSFQRRITLYQPFLQLYLSYVQNRRPKHQFSCPDLQIQYEDMQQSLRFCQKLADSEHIVFGILTTSEFKDQFVAQIKRHQQKLKYKIPISLKQRKDKLYEMLVKHKQVFSNGWSNPNTFITIEQQIQTFQENSLDYSGTIDQNERIEAFYEKITRTKIPTHKNEKKLLTDIKNSVKEFMRQKDSNYTKYRRQIQQDREKFVKNVQSYGVKDESFYDPNSKTQTTYKKIYSQLESIKNVQKYLGDLNNLETYFNLKVTVVGNLNHQIKQYENLQQIWRISYTDDKNVAKLLKEQINKINTQVYLKQAEIARKKLQKYLKDSDLVSICDFSLKKIEKFINNMQTIQFINEQHLRVKDLVQINYTIQKAYNLAIGSINCRQLSYQNFDKMNICDLKMSISQFVFKARKQIQIVNNLSQFNEWWKNVRLDYEPLSQYPSVVIFGDNLKLRDQIDQYMALLLNIINNKYGTFMRNECNKYLRNMNNLVELLQMAEMHQQKFLNLFPILTSKYAESQLSAECKKFDSILHKTMKNVKALIKPTQNLNDNTRNLLKNHIKHFDSISKILSSFLEKKRLKFQRFYFLQDYQLLEVLVGIGDQKNVFRMFQGVKGWLTNSDGIKIGVIGAGDQQLLLKGWNYKTIQPELIFRGLEEAIKNNLNSIVRNVLYHYEVQMKNLRELYEGIPWMCMYVVQMILYCKQVQINCFHNKIPLDYQQTLIKEALGRAVVNPSLYSNYITLLMHLLHFTEQMRKQNVQSIFDFQWFSFLRSYYEKDGVMMRAMNNEIKWGGEYQGVWSMLINTSDIRRAHICVLSSLQYANGVLLQGPSGTGKTESLKQLARCTAKYCVIFNCSQNVNIKSMSKLLSGLCYTGSWLCLDQINRLTVETMSAIAKQIQSIKIAILTKKQYFNFMGKSIKLKQGVAIFSTMNPIYLKRAKLTQNIKSYFRIVSVSMPKYETILQILLFGLKFIKPRELSQKIANTYSNLSVQLTKSAQYDFGLRTMKFMISKIALLRIQSNNELELIAKALYQVFQFRLNSSDRIIFQKIIQDNFQYKPIQNNMNTLSRINTMRQSPHTGLIVFGPTSIKSTLIRQYCNSYKQGAVSLFNPNSVHLKYFMGDSVHGRWEEGVVQKIARQSLNNIQKMHILVLDSILKSQTIQNFNTLLDQSKLLTLPNGSRLKIQNNFKIIMETPHLNLTSPSTITRCNIIYVCDNDVETKQLIQAQLPLQLRNNEVGKKIRKIYSKLNNNEIRQVGKLSKIISQQSYYKNKSQIKENQTLGLEKSIIFAIRLLGIQRKIQQLIKKENSFPIKKLPFHHILSYEKYNEGQFIEISRTYEPQIDYNNFIVKTYQQQFMKWLTLRATKKIKHPILWKGVRMSGKSVGISYALKQQKFIKMCLNKNTNTNQFIKALIPQMLDKKNDDTKQKPQIIVYLQNLNMCNQQSSQQIRYILEHQKMFSTLTNQIVPILSMAFVAQSRHFQNKDFDRVRRHFSELTLPQPDQVQIRNIYGEIVKYYTDKTSLSQSMKNFINIESDRFCTFLAALLNKKNQNLKNKNGMYQAQAILSRIKVLNLKNCKQINDFICYMLQAIKVEDQFKPNSNSQILNQAFLQFYKGKFIKEYQEYLKVPNLILNFENSNSKQEDQQTIIQNQLSMIGKQIYNSQFLRNEICNILRVLQNENVHYCIFSEEGMGKRTLYKLTCQIGSYECQQILQQTNQRQMKKIYFQKLKRGLQKQQKQIIIVNFDNQNYQIILNLAQSIAIGSSASTIFQSTQTDFIFANINDFISDYNKSGKSYQEICQDFIATANKYISLLVVSQNKTQTYEKLTFYPTIYKRMYFKQLPLFPIESLYQCITKIVNNNLKIDLHSKHIVKAEDLPKLFIRIYKTLNSLTQKNRANNLYHFTFNHFHMFKIVQLFCKQFEKTVLRISDEVDNMNRSIMKVGETSQQLIKLRQQITEIEPQINQKKQKIMKVFPVLEGKKRKIEQIRYTVELQRKQIQLKREEMQSMMADVEKKLQEMTPLLNQAVQSIQTIKRSDLSQLKNNTNPHPLVKFTMENMIILLGQSQIWDNIRKVLSDANLLSRIKNCSPLMQNYLKVKKRIAENSEWSYESIAKISYSTKFLYKWIKGIIKYKDIQIEVQKSKQQIEKIKANLKISELKTQQKAHQLTKNEHQLHKVQSQFSEIKNKLNDLQKMMQRNKLKYQNAQNISVMLKDNLTKWEQRLTETKQIKNYLIFYCINLCLELKIYSNLNNQQKIFVKEQILKIFTQSKINLPKDVNILKDLMHQIDEKNMLTKLNQKQLNDPKKVMLAYNFYNQPIIIDPDNQVLKWLARLCEGKKIKYIKQNFPGAHKTVEESMKYGQILVVLLDGQINKFGKQIIKSISKSSSINRHLIEYNKNTFHLHEQFILLFYCKSKNPKISLIDSLQHQVINFEITKHSINENLLQAVLQNQKPQLHQVKTSIELNVQKITKNIEKMQKQIVKSLLNSRKQLTEDQTFVNLLNQNLSQMKSLANYKQQQKNRTAQIQRFNNEFNKLCSEVADVFISIKQLHRVNSNLIWDADILIQYFIKSCKQSIGQDIANEEDDSEELLNQNIMGTYTFEQVGLNTSRPSTALSNLSISLSRVASEQNQQDNITEYLETARLKELKSIDQNQQQIIEINSPAANNNRNSNQSPTQTNKQSSLRLSIGHKQQPILFKNRKIKMKQQLRGILSVERQTLILTNLYSNIKKGLKEKDRLIWSLVIAFKEEKKQDIKCLCNLIQGRNKKRNIKMLSDQNMLTLGIKSFINKFDPNKIQEEIRKLFVNTQQSLQKLSKQLSLTEILIVSFLICPQKFMSVANLIISQHKLNSITQYQDIKASQWIHPNDNVHPVLLMMGEDPINMLSQYLQRKQYKNATLIAMGQEQGKGLDAHIQKQSFKQGIFIIHNLHIAPSFYTVLGRIIQQFSYRPPHKNFRLILISSVEVNLPQQIVSMCHKFIVEQPEGLKNKVKGFYKKTESWIDHSIQIQHKLAYSLCLMHSLVNQMQQFGHICWNFPTTYTTDDFLSSLLVIKSAQFDKSSLHYLQCNIQNQQIENQLNSQKINFERLRYLIGQTCYIAKMSDNIDRKKMRIIIQNHFNEKMLNKNYIFWQGSKLSQDPSQVNKCIQSIEQDNPRTYGLDETTVQSKQIMNALLQQIYQIYSSNKVEKSSVKSYKFQQIKSINHKLRFINQQIQTYNSNGVYQQNIQYLKLIDENSKIFYLKVFSNPRQLFVHVKIEAALKNNVPYDSIALVWSSTQRQGFYGINNLILQGACLKNNTLVPGSRQKQITLFFSTNIKKKDKDPNKGKVAIPLYLNEERGQSFGTFGENTNLLTQVFLDSRQSSQVWVIKGTAFVVS